MKRQIKTGMEQDVHTPWRHKLILQATYVRYVKRLTNRRERREARAALRRDA